IGFCRVIRDFDAFLEQRAEHDLCVHEILRTPERNHADLDFVFGGANFHQRTDSLAYRITTSNRPSRSGKGAGVSKVEDLEGRAGSPLPAAGPNTNYGAHGATRPTGLFDAPPIFQSHPKGSVSSREF